MKYSDNQKLAFCQPRGQFPTAHAQIALCSSIRIIEDSDNRDSDNRGSTVTVNGTAVTRSLDITDSDTDLLYSVGDTGALRLHRRGSVSGPTGSYCCVIPDNTGVDVTFCVQLGKWVCVLILLLIMPCFSD